MLNWPLETEAGGFRLFLGQSQAIFSVSMKRFCSSFVAFFASGLILLANLGENELADLSPHLQVVLTETQALEHSRAERLPLWVLPISGHLAQVKDSVAAETLRELDRRGIGYTVDWNPDRAAESLAEGLRIGRMQQNAGLNVGVNANACLYSFFDGSDEMLHVDEAGAKFSDSSFGKTLGCPFAIEHRYPSMKRRMAQFLDGYRREGIEIDFIFADWEIDGPIEWNDAWASSKRCQKCRSHIPRIDDFRVFQREVRRIRSDMQRIVFGDHVRSVFPQALVGNYGVYPHEGHRYWYDYFEKETMGAPFRLDQKAKYREWYPEFPETGYTFAMPVVYTWYQTFNWYDFDSPDYRWFYNMLLVGSSVGKSSPSSLPIIPFVHWHTTAPPSNPDPGVKQFSKEAYKELLWHLLLRGHDTFFLWCLNEELATEIGLVHQVYRESLEYASFLDQGIPISFDVPNQPGTVVSGLRVKDQVLVRRSDFENGSGTVSIRLADDRRLVVPKETGTQVLTVRPDPIRDGLIKSGGKSRFPIGMYELPSDEDALFEMVKGGVNLFRCGNRADLDRLERLGVMGWMPLGVQSGASPELRKRIEAVAGHPALAVWEGPDEIVWTYTAYSFLERVAGFTREDWNNEVPKAVQYAASQSDVINPAIHSGIQLIRELDPNGLPFWINEAADSDVGYARETIDSVDIVGCDYYAVRGSGTDLLSVGRLVDRWDAIGYGRPVWMVLQGFSWHAIKPERALLYPSFEESRFMAYDSIVRGAKGIFYWGTNTIDDPKFREALYAVTSELSAIEPMLVGKTMVSATTKVIDDLFDPAGVGVRVLVKERGSDTLVILVNEDSHRHLGVDVMGLENLEGRTLHRLYGDERQTVKRKGFVTRMQGYEVKVFCTNPIYQSSRQLGRDYVSSAQE